LPETILRFSLAAVLALSGLKLLDVPYANEMVLVALAAGLAALIVWGATVALRRTRPAAAKEPPAT
jgi:hypothetical protein